MKTDVTALREEIEEALRECQGFCCFTRGKEFQAEALEKLRALLARASDVKRRMVGLADEDAANATLSLECVLAAFANELQMWIALKDNELGRAWEHLVGAQSAAHTAIRVHETGRLLQHYPARLDAVEHIIFPPQVFFSPSLVIRHVECSLCGENYDECGHIAGRAYMGEMCARIIKSAEVKEISIVEVPANKMARLITISEGGISRDFLTWRPKDNESAPILSVE